MATKKGDTIIYETNKRGIKRRIKGIVQEIKASGSMLRNLETGRRRKGYKLKIKPLAGGRAFWTDTMALNT